MRSGSVLPLNREAIASKGAGLRLPLLLLLAAVLLLAVLPLPAHALTTERFTAKSNQDGADGIMGATPTRITWQGQSDANESLASITITLPEGSVLPADGTTVTMALRAWMCPTR